MARGVQWYATNGVCAVWWPPPISFAPMARYKYIDTTPRFLAVDLAQQLLPGTFEHAVHHLLEHEIELSSFDARFQNDETGTRRRTRPRCP